MGVDIGDEAMVVDGIKGNVDFPIEGVVAGEGGQVHGVGDEQRRVGSHERGYCEWPSVGDTIEVHAAGMYIVAVVDVVMVKPDVMGVALGSILEGEFLTILDMIFKSVIVHGKPCKLVDYLLLMLFIGGLVCEGGGDLS